MGSMSTPLSARSSRHLRIALIASLLCNIVVVGLVAGALLRGPGPGPEHGRGPRGGELSFGPYNDALSEADRQALRRAFMDRAPDFGSLRVQMRGEFEALLKILRSAPYDPAAAEKIVNAQQARASTAFALGHSLLLERIAQMSDAERLAFADRLEYAINHPPRRGGHGDRDDGRGGDEAPEGEAPPAP